MSDDFALDFIHSLENKTNISSPSPELEKYLLDIKVEDILRFEAELFDYVETKYPEILESIRETKELTEETEQKLIQAIEECKKSFR